MNKLPSERAAAIALVTIRTAVCAYRAATQSFVHDEAYTFNRYLAGSWDNLYFQYDANNHLLFSILSKLSMLMFGTSEFALRLPSVIAGFFLMLGVWKILENVDSRAVRWVAFLAIGLHPMILDFSTAARGYGLATALFVWAVLTCMKQRYKTAGVLLGLAVSASFTAAIPALALLVACVLVGAGEFARRLGRTIGMALLATVPILITCAGVFPLMRGNFFYAGIPALSDSVHNLVYDSILATPRIGLFGTWAAADVLTFRVLPTIVLFIALASLFAWRTEVDRELLPIVTFGAAAVGMIAAHYLTQMQYPIDRTGLILMFLFGIAWAFAADFTNKWFRAANLLLGALLAIQFATQFHTSYFQVWWYDRSTNVVARDIERESRNKPPGSVSVSATWLHQPALEYYRVRDHFTALKPVPRLEVSLVTGEDFYVLNEQDKNFALIRDHTILFSDPYAGVVLAK